MKPLLIIRFAPQCLCHSFSVPNIVHCTCRVSALLIYLKSAALSVCDIYSIVINAETILKTVYHVSWYMKFHVSPIVNMNWLMVCIDSFQCNLSPKKPKWMNTWLLCVCIVSALVVISHGIAELLCWHAIASFKLFTFKSWNRSTVWSLSNPWMGRKQILPCQVFDSVCYVHGLHNCDIHHTSTILAQRWHCHAHEWWVIIEIDSFPHLECNPSLVLKFRLLYTGMTHLLILLRVAFSCHVMRNMRNEDDMGYACICTSVNMDVADGSE